MICTDLFALNCSIGSVFPLRCVVPFYEHMAEQRSVNAKTNIGSGFDFCCDLMLEIALGSATWMC